MSPKNAVAANPPSKAAPNVPRPALAPVTLSIDIGGSGLKAMLLDARGKPISERERIVTPAVPTPQRCPEELETCCASDCPASIASRLVSPASSSAEPPIPPPTCIPSGLVFPLGRELEKRWKKPARVANDAAVQGYGAIKGQGVELLLTLGTGMGSALFTDGKLCPGLELGHHPWREKTYEDYLGRRGLDKYGKKHWNKRLQEAIEQTAATFNWDHLYLGGGNTKKIEFKLPKNVSIVSNEEGILGGVALWRDGR